MAGYSTSLVAIGLHGVGPFGERAWRAHHGIVLLEKHRLAWLSTPIGFGASADASHDAVYLPHGWRPGAELAFVVAATVVRDEKFLSLLESHGLVAHVEGDTPHLQRRLEISHESLATEVVIPPSVMDAAVSSIGSRVRLGITQLESWSALGHDEVLWLRTQGLDVDVFTLEPA